MDNQQLIFGTGVSANKEYDALYSTISIAIDNGIYGFDTAPSYHTEKLLGKALNQCITEKGIDRSKLFIQTKIDAWQMYEKNGEISSYVQQALLDMELEYFDSLLIHWPIPEYLDKTWESFVELYNRGLAKQIGICNLRLHNLKKVSEYDFKPHIIQIERNPLRVCSKEILFCLEKDIKVQAYSPLCKMDNRISDNDYLKILSQKYNKSIGQIVLRWHIDTGVVPIFTSKNLKRIQEYANIFDFSLDLDEIKNIDMLNENYKIYLESFICPGF